MNPYRSTRTAARPATRRTPGLELMEGRLAPSFGNLSVLLVTPPPPQVTPPSFPKPDEINQFTHQNGHAGNLLDVTVGGQSLVPATSGTAQVTLATPAVPKFPGFFFGRK